VTRAVPLLVVAAVLVAVWASGAAAQLTPQQIAEWVARAGIFGPLAYVALFSAAELAHLPGVLFVLAAALLWPPAIAIPTAYAGAVCASLVVFLVSRRIVPGDVRKRLPEWLLRWESSLESHGLRTVIGLRAVLFMLPTVHWLLGASRVSLRDYALGTAVGLLPGVVLYVLLGRQAWAHWDALRPWLLGAGALLLALAVARRVTSPRPSP